jgi:membrane-associated PAP2 superfamily phosphatase
MLRDLNPVFIVAVLTALIATILIKLARPERPSPISPSASFFIFTTLIAGPVIVVNGIFKTFSGRPRPVHVDQFGGDFPFVPVWQFSEHCPRTCSFVSGEGSSAFWALAVWLVLPPRIRRMVAVPVFVYVAAISLNRVTFGAHFLSDVLLSWAFMALIIAVAWRWIIERPPEWMSNARAEERWTRAGLALRRLVRGG